MTTTNIQFSEDVLRRHSSRPDGAGDNPGIVFSRINSRGGRDSDNQMSKSRSSMSGDDADFQEKATPIDHRVKQTFKGRHLLWLAYQSMGVIYGDIGTSPLYVFSSTFTSGPSKDDVVGVLSLIIWSLLTMVTLKYVFIILRADNEGEGGTFSCYSLLSRYANLANIDPKEAHSLKIQRVLTGEMPRGNRSIRARIEKSAFFRGLLKTIGVLAVSLVIADGVLTPAQSVLGAYQGLNVITTVDTSTVVGATCGTLVLLFLIQPLGTTRIASTFAPIVVIWLGWIGGIGLFNLIKYDYTVLKAFNPGEAFMFLIRHKEEGWHSLGGVLLCFTGLEALFAVSTRAGTFHFDVRHQY
jgi:KUP system potassium uptake protein